jgi:hypothetical protein
MSHGHAEKAVASQIKSIASAGTAKMMDSTMGKMAMGSMMNEGMGTMMRVDEGMALVMKHSKTPGVATGVASGVVASAGSSTGKSGLSRIFTHPLVLFGLGVVVGCYVYKYRKSIISISDEAQQE